MPKETFFNLPETKRTIIETIAIDEFAEYGFDKASISRMTEKCEIAKGSFYQYFEGKKDLFLHLMDLVVKEKLKFLAPTMENPAEHNFFELLKDLYISGLEFANTHPKLVQIGNQVLKNKDHPVYYEAIGSNMSKSYKVFDSLLKLAISRGEVQPDIDISFVSYIISSMNLATVEYYFEVVKGDSDKVVEWNNDMLDTVNLFINFIKHGISVPIKEVVNNDKG